MTPRHVVSFSCFFTRMDTACAVFADNSASWNQYTHIRRSYLTFGIPQKLNSKFFLMYVTVPMGVTSPSSKAQDFLSYTISKLIPCMSRSAPLLIILGCCVEDMADLCLDLNWAKVPEKDMIALVYEFETHSRDIKDACLLFEKTGSSLVDAWISTREKR